MEMMMKLIKFYIIASLFFFASVSPTLAETKTFVREYTYQASEFDSKASCRTLALEQVKRLLLEEIGTYLESLTEVNNFQLTKDQIIVLTAGIVRVQVVDEKWDGKAYYLLAKITANPDDVAKAIDNLRKDRQKIKELEQAKRKSDDLFKQVENLREELRTSKNKKTKAFRKKQNEYEKMINSVNAIEWFNLGMLSDVSLFQDVSSIKFDDQYRANMKATYERQIFAFSKAISLNPHYTEAYVERGVAYYYNEQYQKSLHDFNKAIELNPELVRAYQQRAGTYAKLGKCDQMMKDYYRAITLAPNDRDYIYLNTTSCESEEFGISGLEQAIEYITKVIEFDYELAIRDYDKIIELNPTWHNYRSRGQLFVELKKYHQALQDYTMAINNYKQLRPAEPAMSAAAQKTVITVAPETNKKDGDKSELYLARREIYENIGDKEHAEQDLIEAIKVDPDAAPVSRAERLLKRSRYGDAIQAINEDVALAIRIMPQNSDRLLLEGYVFRCLCYYQMKNYNRALIECTDGTKKDSGDVEIRSALYVMRSIIYRSMGDYRNSLSDLNQAIDINPQKSEIYILRGIYYLKRDSYQNALKDFEKVAVLDPKDWRGSIRSILNECKKNDKSNQRVLKDIFYEDCHDIPNKFQILQKKYPQFQKRFAQVDKVMVVPVISKEKEWFVIGKAFFESENYERAIDAFSKAIKIAPTYIDAYLERGTAFRELKKYREAIKDYDRVIALDPKMVKAYSKRGDAYRELKNYQKAIKDFDAAIALSPFDTELYNGRGYIYVELGNYQQSITDYSSAIELGNKSKYVYLQRGSSYHKLGKNIQAIEDFNKAIEIDSKYYLAYAFRGRTYREMRSYQQAIKDFDKAIELNPQEAFFYFSRANTYNDLKDLQRAIIDYKVAARLGNEDAQEILKMIKEHW
ncbi:MAG: tetratricopeptide repeat protein [Deltaproteobacteria bacterium]|nr:tetratricopeptide repeat protein [Deltaproteobacteria bacterium]